NQSAVSTAHPSNLEFSAPSEGVKVRKSVSSSVVEKSVTGVFGKILIKLPRDVSVEQMFAETLEPMATAQSSSPKPHKSISQFVDVQPRAVKLAPDKPADDRGQSGGDTLVCSRKSC
ncbi:hypothetical protein KUCAC02_013227, partial [Chaenocephalus aceratus]